MVLSRSHGCRRGERISCGIRKPSGQSVGSGREIRKRASTRRCGVQGIPAAPEFYGLRSETASDWRGPGGM